MIKANITIFTKEEPEITLIIDQIRFNLLESKPTFFSLSYYL
jgi:hypothetical protein